MLTDLLGAQVLVAFGGRQPQAGLIRSIFRKGGNRLRINRAAPSGTNDRTACGNT
jgi:hypothetical protein